MEQNRENRGRPHHQFPARLQGWIMFSSAPIRLRSALLGFSIDLGLFGLWMLLPELSRPKPVGFHSIATAPKQARRARPARFLPRKPARLGQIFGPKPHSPARASGKLIARLVSSAPIPDNSLGPEPTRRRPSSPPGASNARQPQARSRTWASRRSSRAIFAGLGSNDEEDQG